MKNKFLFSVFVYFIILVLLSLGSWQLYRLNWKLNLISEIENSLKNDPVELLKSNKKNYLRIKTSGQIDFDKQIYIYNLNKSGKPGFEVINPILIGNENYLINRGWISFDQKDQSEINFVNEDKIIGTIFLAVCLARAKKGHFTKDHHFGFEAAAWYWHFVDVVWLFLFAAIYVWGS